MRRFGIALVMIAALLAGCAGTPPQQIGDEVRQAVAYARLIADAGLAAATVARMADPPLLTAEQFAMAQQAHAGLGVALAAFEKATLARDDAARAQAAAEAITVALDLWRMLQNWGITGKMPVT